MTGLESASRRIQELAVDVGLGSVEVLREDIIDALVIEDDNGYAILLDSEMFEQPPDKWEPLVRRELAAMVGMHEGPLP